MNKNVLRHGPIIKLVAQANDIPAHILAGLVEQESGGNEFAIRVEPGYRWLFGDDPHEDLKKPQTQSAKTEWAGQRISWGLGQVMGAVAREHGFSGWFPRLCCPTVGLIYAGKHLAWCISRKRNIAAGLLRYNGGGDPNYPDAVLAKAAKYQTKL